MNQYNTVHLKKGKEESLGRFHPWVFSGAIHHIDGRPEEGDVVRVVSADGRFLAVGHIQIGSIAVRVLSFEDIAIDQPSGSSVSVLLMTCARASSLSGQRAMDS